MNLGYACINMELSEQGVSTNRGMIKRSFEKRGPSGAADLAIQNLTDLCKVLRWNHENGIRVYRMSSCLFPWMSEYEFKELERISEIRDLCTEVGKISNETGQRLSFHPGQFNVLASHTEKCILASIRDLDQHGAIMDMMNLRSDSYNIINIHVGGSYGDRDSAMQRFCQNFQKLSASARKRLTVENDDKASLFAVNHLYEGVHAVIGIPIVFDYLHHKLCDGGLSEEEALRLAISTWPDGIVPVTHYASSKKIHEDPKSPQQSHAEMIHERIETYGLRIDIELEAKGKERALMNYLKNFK